MPSNFRFSRGGVSARLLGITTLIAILFVAGCTTSKSEVNIGPPAKLAFTVQPGSVAAGSTITVTASVEDASGNVVPTATNQVTIAIGTNRSGGTLAGTATATAVNGVATFSNLSINNAGTGYTLVVSATGLSGATSNPFNVAGQATKLAFTVQPSAVINGSSITPAVTVSIEDANGIVVPNATNQITIAIGTNPSAGTLSGTAQANAVAGVATFSNLSINKIGTGYTLTAGATNLTGATSSAFNVTVGPPAKLAFTVQPVNTTAGVAISPAVQVTVEDAQGNTVTTATNIINMGIGTGSGSLIGTTAVAAVNGVATFSNLNINVAGTGDTLSATATGLTGATSSAFNVLVGAASKLVFTGEPSNVAAGSSITPAVTVSVEDNVGNVVPTATNQITIAIGTNPSSGTLSGTAQANAVAGVATFSNLSINKVGTGYTLTNSASGLTGTTSTAFNVTPGTASKLVFSAQPTNVAAGGSITPSVTVSVEDALGNLVTTATNQITIAIGTNPSGGTLSGTAVAAASGGVATFSNLSINKTGTGYTLTAAATNLTGATSNAFNVTVGAATKLAFTAQPTNTTAGSSVTPSVTVSVEDSLGNVVSTATNQITIAIGTNPSSGVLSGTAVANAVAGLATFSNLSINSAGTGYTLTAAATSLTGATSSAFNISAGAATKLVFTTQPTNVAAGSSIAPAVTVSFEDSLNNVVTTSNGTVTLVTNPSVTLGGTSAVAAVNGVATFANLSINTAANGYTLVASAGVLTGTSTPFNVTVGAAAKLAFTAQPTNVTAGSSIAPAVTVSVEDSVGNVLTAATNQITMAIANNPSSGTLGGTVTVAAVSGVATFSTLSINSAGVGYTLKASATGLTNATSAAFNVTAGAKSKLAFTVQPSNVIPGSSISPAVAVSEEDSLGNVVTSATDSITVAIGTNPGSPSPGTLAGTLTVAAVNGVATFPNLSINNSGVGYTLTASASGFTTVTSNAFSNVALGVPAKLAFSVQPSNVAAGSSITPSVTVTVEDGAGTPINSATNSITITIGTNPSSGTLGGTLTVAAVNGVATFSTLNINNAGTGYTLTASASGLTGATSSTFNVTAGSSNKLVFSAQPTSVTAGSSISPSVTVSVEDSLGNLVTTASNSITVAIGTNPSGGTLGGTLAVAAVNGVATFSTLSINKAGTSYTLTANASTLTGASSTPFNVTVGAPNKLAFTAQPTTETAGSAISPVITVSVEDSLGNVVTTATNSISMAIGTNPSSGTLGGTLTVAAVNGVATFSTLNINNAGNGYTLIASAATLTSATSTTFNVTAGVANKLAFTAQPTNVTAGSFITPAVTVSVEDSLGNVVTSANNSITVTIGTNPSTGTLGGTLTVAAVNGVATFSTLNINNAGTGYTLGAGASGFTTITSNSFNVTVGAASKLAFTAQPTSVTAGSSITPSVTVSIEDASGNVMTSATNSITIAIGTNPSSGTLGGTVTVAAVNGVATFSTLNINKAGLGYTLTANASTLTGTTSSTFNVNAGSANKLAFTVQPSNVTVGSTISPSVAVSVEDSLGNVVTTATNSITVAIGTNPSSGTLAGTLTVAAVNGVASFSTLNINIAGTGYTLTASAATLTSATSNTFNVTANCTNNCTISGTVTGAWGSGVKITLSGGPSTPAPAVTNSSGAYSFTGLTQGTYTITPSLTGYGYAPSAPSVSIGASTVQNFTASSVIPSYSISGTVSGSSDSTHVLYITVYNCGGGTNCNPVAGTTLPSITTNGGAYTIRGLRPSNNYSVRAEIDTQNNGAPNEADPAGTISGINISSANVTGANITVAAQTIDSPGAPGTPTVFPGGGAAFVTYNSSTSNTTGDEIATSYTLHYGTSSGSLTQSATIAAGNSNQVYILPGLVNGTTYFFAMSATNSKGTSANSATSAGVLINSSSGAGPNTISGTVTFNITPNGSAPLYVGLYSGTLGVYFERIAPPFSSGVAYSIPGVPSGNYQMFAVLDQNNNNYIDAGDVTNFTGANGPPPFVVSASSSGNTIVLTAASAATFVTTNHSLSGSTNTYDINVGVNLEQKLPVSMTLFSGPNVAVPFDMDGGTNNNDFQPIFNNSVRPLVGDLYQFLVTYSDGTTQVLSNSVSTVLDSFAQNLQMNSPVAGSATVPVLNWQAPAAPPAFYTYKVKLNNFNGSQEGWDYPNDSNGLPIGSTNVQYNKNGNANPNAPLIAGETYDWAVTVLDANSNTAEVSGPNYTVPGGSPLSPVVTLSFNPTSISVSGTATLVFNINNPNGSASLSGIAFSDSLTGGLTVAGTTPTNGCGATLTGTGSGSTSINVSNVSLAAGASCQVGINVTSGTTGTVNNQTSTVTSNEAGTGSTSNTASLTVGGSGTLPPTIGVAFNPTTITVNFSTTLTFTINNPNGSSSLSGVTFTDNLPSNLFVLSPNNGLSGSCGSGTISAVAGSQLISLTNGTLAGGGGCTFSVNVTATATGTINDTTGNISSNEGGTGGTSNTAALTVNSASSTPAVLISGLPSAPFFAGGAATTLTLTVSNDAAGDVLTPSLTVDANTGLACTAATCGTIGAVSGTSGSGNYTVPYTPPSSLAAETAPTINVSSSLSGAFAGTTTVSAYPAGQLVLTVTGVPNIVQVGSAPPTVKMTVYNDIGSAGVNEGPLTSTGFTCSSLNGNSCGTLNDHSGVTVVDNGTTTTTTFTYSPPATVPSEPFNRPRIVAASVASPAVSGQRSFLLSSTAEPTPLSIPFAQKFNTVLTNSAAFAVTANLNGDSGNSRTINWTINANGSPCAPPTCGTLGSPAVVRNGGAISSTVNYTPPTTVPTGTGQSSPTITATSVDIPSATDGFSFQINDGTCGSGSESILKGNYAFLLKGAGAGNGYTAEIGSFVADGNGNITSGLEDINRSTGALTGLTISGTYTVGSDHRGCVKLTTSNNMTQSFRIALGTLSGAPSTATEGSIVTSSDNNGQGLRAQGVLMQQNTTAFKAASLSGTYVFGREGVDFGGGPFVIAGLLTANGVSTLSNISTDYDDYFTGATNQPGPYSGTFSIATNAPGGRGTSQTTISSVVDNFVFYVVSPSEILSMSTDATDQNHPIQSGEIKLQTGTFTATTMDNSGYVIYTTGTDGGDGANQVGLGQAAVTTNGAVTIILDKNQNGVMNPDNSGNPGPEQNVTGASFVISATGRTTLSGAGSGNPIFYLVDSTQALFVSTNSAGSGIEFGHLLKQTGTPFSNTTLPATAFFLGAATNTGSSYDSGTLTFNTVADTFTGTDDSSASPCSQNCSGNGLTPNSPITNHGAALPYSFAAFTNSQATFTPTATGQGIFGGNGILAYQVSPTKVVFMQIGATTTTGFGGFKPTSALVLSPAELYIGQQ